jgi:tetratricopeptide (TPR) repeat protein
MSRFAALLLLPLLAACPGGAQEPAEPVDAAAAAEAFQRGRGQQLQHLRAPSNERLAAAIEQLERAAELDSTQATHHYYAGSAREERDDHLLARAHYERAVGGGPAPHTPRGRRGGRRPPEGDLPGARAQLERVRVQELGDHAATAKLDLGRVREDQGDLAAARDLYREAVDLRAGETQAWFRLSHVLDRLGDADGADQARARYEATWELEQRLAQARHAVRQTPADPAAHWAVARAAAELGLISQALAACRETLALVPGHGEAAALLAELEEGP